jgi:hypothetical protein
MNLEDIEEIKLLINDIEFLLQEEYTKKKETLNSIKSIKKDLLDIIATEEN